MCARKLSAACGWPCSQAASIIRVDLAPMCIPCASTSSRKAGALTIAISMIPSSSRTWLMSNWGWKRSCSAASTDSWYRPFSPSFRKEIATFCAGGSLKNVTAKMSATILEWTATIFAFCCTGPLTNLESFTRKEVINVFEQRRPNQRSRGKVMNARVMDHEEAIRNFTAERYLLGELTEDDRDAYEDHLFSCPVCFEQVKAGTEFVSQLRHISKEEVETITHPGFIGTLMSGLRQPVSMVAFTLLFCAVGLNVYQNRLISGFRHVQVAPAAFLSDGAKAEGIKQVTVPRSTRFFNLNFQLLQKGS